VSAAGIELVRRAFAAFERADAAAFAACFDPDAEFLLPRNLLEGGSYRGRAEIERAVADAYETWSAVELRVDEVEPTESGLVVSATVVNTPRHGGPAVEYRATYGARVGARGITYWSSYDGPAEARAGLGAVR
jgi:ketosteroid isomerase-like protein